MRVFIHDYGGYAFSAQLAKALADREHQVYYSHSITTQRLQRFSPDSGNKNLTIAGVQLDCPFSRSNYLQRWRVERAHGRSVAQQVRKFRPDVILSANTPLDAQALILRASREVGAGFIFWMQDVISEATGRALKLGFRLLGQAIGSHYMRLERSLVTVSDAVIVIAPGFHDTLADWGIDPGKVHIIPNWAVLEEIPVLPKTNPFSLAENLADKFVFLFTGVLGLKHDPNLFLALAKSFKDQPDVRVVVVSAGPLAEKLQLDGIQSELENLILLPYATFADYPQLLASADVLMSILKEDASAYSVPSKVYAYMCAARPLLLSISVENPIARLVTDQQMGLTAEPADTQSWLTSAHMLYQNRYNNHHMGAKARAYAEGSFVITHIADEFEGIMRKVKKSG